jgi:hypothetical protein
MLIDKERLSDELFLTSSPFRPRPAFGWTDSIFVPCGLARFWEQDLLWDNDNKPAIEGG